MIFLYEINWNGKIYDVMNTSLDEYDVEMLTKIRENGMKSFIIQF